MDKVIGERLQGTEKRDVILSAAKDLLLSSAFPAVPCSLFPFPFF